MEGTDNNNLIGSTTGSTTGSAEFVVGRFSDFQEADFEDILVIADSLNTQMGSIFTTQQLRDNITNLNEMVNQAEISGEVNQVVAGLETVNLLATATQVFEHNKQLNQLMSNEALTGDQKQEQAAELIASAKSTIYEGSSNTVGIFSPTVGLETNTHLEVNSDLTENFGDLMGENTIDKGADFLMDKMGLKSYIDNNKEAIREKVFGLSTVETTIETSIQENIAAPVQDIELPESTFEVSEEFSEIAVDVDMIEPELNHAEASQALQLVAEIENNMNALMQELEDLKSNVGGI